MHTKTGDYRFVGRTLLAMLALSALLTASTARADVLFSEDFEGVTGFSNGTNPGIPLKSEGANETWYGGRFEDFDGGTIDQDVAVRRPRSNSYARFEDEAGILFNINTTGLVSATLKFDYKTHYLESDDDLVVGYFIGDLGFDLGANRRRDFYTDDFGGDHDDAVAWWDTSWTEILRTNTTSWSHLQSALPVGEASVWVAFWLDGSECDYGKVDNIVVCGTPVPEPATMSVLALGGVALLRRRKA